MNLKITSVCLAVLLWLSGCGRVAEVVSPPTPTPTPQQQVVGKWVRVSGRNATVPFSLLMPDQIEFLRDGVWTVPGSGVLNGKYSFVEVNRLRLEGLQVLVFVVNVSFTPTGGAMVLESAGEKVEYKRG